MHKYKKDQNFTVIFADHDLETFKKINQMKQDYHFINLNSDFAVNFVMEYEKVDLMIISRNIGDLENIIKKAQRKKIKVYQIGKDLKAPLGLDEVEKILKKEYRKKTEQPPAEKKMKISELLSRFTRAEEKEAKKTEQKAKQKEKKQVPRAHKKVQQVKAARPKPAANKKIPVPKPKVRAIKQKTIVFLKTKGGVGSTVLSIYMGYCLKNLKTLLIDLNFSQGGGDISYYLNIPKFPNLVNFTSGYNGKSIEESTINFKDGLDIMQAPPTLELAKIIELQDIYSLVDMVKKKYDMIIFDLPNSFNDLNMGVIDLADILIMVTDGSVGSIGRLAEINKQLSYSELSKILVFNKQNPRKPIDFGQYYRIFSIKDMVNIEYLDLLAYRSDFSRFDFSCLDKLETLNNMIFDLLTTVQVVNK